MISTSGEYKPEKTWIMMISVFHDCKDAIQDAANNQTPTITADDETQIIMSTEIVIYE
jgi:hypothetical protein